MKWKRHSKFPCFACFPSVESQGKPVAFHQRYIFCFLGENFLHHSRSSWNLDIPTGCMATSCKPGTWGDADINFANPRGKTPLHVEALACLKGFYTSMCAGETFPMENTSKNCRDLGFRNLVAILRAAFRLVLRIQPHKFHWAGCENHQFKTQNHLKVAVWSSFCSNDCVTPKWPC